MVLDKSKDKPKAGVANKPAQQPQKGQNVKEAKPGPAGAGAASQKNEAALSSKGEAAVLKAKALKVQAMKAQMAASKAQSEAAKAHSEAQKALSDAAKVKSEAARVKSEAAKAKSEAAKAKSDAAAAQSEAARAQSMSAKALKREALVKIYNEAMMIQNQTMRITSLVVNNIKTMVVMRGCPGSGKSFFINSLSTHLSRELAKARGDTLPAAALDHHWFHADEFWIHPTTDKYTFNNDYIEYSHLWCQKLVRQACVEGRSPLFIGNTHSRLWEMKFVVSTALEFGYVVEIVEPVTKWAFDVEELTSRNIHGINSDAIQRMVDRYEHGIKPSHVMTKYNLSYPANAQPPQKCTFTFNTLPSKSQAKIFNSRFYAVPLEEILALKPKVEGVQPQPIESAYKTKPAVQPQPIESAYKAKPVVQPQPIESAYKTKPVVQPQPIESAYRTKPVAPPPQKSPRDLFSGAPSPCKGKNVVDSPGRKISTVDQQQFNQQSIMNDMMKLQIDQEGELATKPSKKQRNRKKNNNEKQNKLIGGSTSTSIAETMASPQSESDDPMASWFKQDDDATLHDDAAKLIKYLQASNGRVEGRSAPPQQPLELNRGALSSSGLQEWTSAFKQWLDEASSKGQTTS